MTAHGRLPRGTQPAELTSFVGRQRELAELRSLLADRRLVTLVGSGGCGKTRLATRFAAQCGDQWPDGTRFIDLSAVTTAEEVDRTVAAAVGVAEAPGVALRELVAAHLHTTNLLLIFDNCEQVIEAAALTVRDLLQRCDGIVVLATSREPLKVEGETTYRVPSLDVESAHPDDLPDAVRLFVDRAQSVQPDFQLTAHNASAVREIAARLDGIPLALELAAARLGVLSASEIADGLTDRFRMLGHGARAALPRQQTLRGSVEWSYHLLTDSERALLRRLSVFVAGCDLDAAAAVTTFEPLDTTRILDVLAGLADRSLLVVDATGARTRYRMLETIREFAAEQLVMSGEVEQTRHRHLDHCLSLVREAWRISEADQIAALALIDSERENLYAGIDWALACGRVDDALRVVGELWGYWASQGRFVEGRAIAERVVYAASDTAEPGALAAGLFAMSWIEEMHGDYLASYEHAEKALDLAAAVGDRRLEGRCLARIGLSLCGLDLAAGSQQLEAAIEIARETGDTTIHHVCLCQLGWFRQVAEGPIASRPLLLEARELTQRRNDYITGAQAEVTLALAEFTAGDIEAALAHAETGRDLAAASRNPYYESVGWWAMSGCRIWRGDVAGGVAAAATGDAIMPAGRNFATSGGYTYRALAHLIGGDLSAAIHHGREAVEAADAFGPWMSAMWKRQAYAILVRAHWRLGDLEAAWQAADAALELARRTDSVYASDAALTAVAALSRATGDPQRADSLVREALLLASRTGMYGGVVELVELLAALAVDDAADKLAAWLFGVADRHRRVAGAGGCWTEPVAESRKTARERLGVEAFDAAWQEGESVPVEAAVAQLVQQPSRVKRPATGWPSLTDSERRVVELVAEGLSNAAIAERLFISRRTVDAHLNHVYTKLGMSSRTELVAAALSRK